MATDDGTADLAARAYIYGFPLVFNLEQVERFVTTGIGAMAPAPFNRLSHARTLAGPADTFVSINNDTLYSMAQLDLGVGPVRLHVPDSAGRYYVLQMVDAWTNNFAYIGHRATGTAEGDFVVVPPGWTGDVPDSATVIHAPTRLVSMVGRWACDGEADLPAVHALQDAMRLEPVDPDATPAGLPVPDPTVPAGMAFLERLRVWSQAFPPPPRDDALQAGLAPIGVTDEGPSPFAGGHPEAAALTAGLAAGEARLDEVLARGGASPVVDGWKLTLHVFDYNLDFFEVGALDDPEFKIADPEARVVERAGAAKAGLWGNHAYEAVYLMTYVDDRGDQLVGERTYTLRLDPPPPVDAFWSLTMYALPDFYLVANDIDRYSIGDRTSGLVYGDDGSLTLTISGSRPEDAAAAANWLPAPAGAFRPIMRMYEPRPEVLDATYTLPQITRS